MKSLLTISDAELASIEAQERFGVVPAIGVAASSAVLAFGGMAMRFSPGDAVPVSGMDHPLGQLVLSGLLAGGMLLAAAVIRGVFMKRLQWTVLLSLLVHAVICLTLNNVTVNTPLLAIDAPPADVPMDELSLPDYGGMEEVQNETQQWEQPSEIDLQENQHERSEQELDMQAEPEQVQPDRRVEQAATPDRRPSEQQPSQRNEPEIQKQAHAPDPKSPQQVETPQVETQEIQQPNHEARELNRVAEQLENMQRERLNVERQTSPSVNASSIARRSDFRPEDVLRVEVEQQRRRAAESRLADATAVPAEVAEASSRPSMSAAARAMNQQRQADSSLPRRSSATESALADSHSPTVNSASIARASSSNAMQQPSAPTGGGTVSMNRNVSTASGGGAAGAAAPSVNVAAAASSGGPSLAASQAASGSSRSPSSLANSGMGGGGSSAPSNRLSATGMTSRGTSLARSGQSSGPSMGDTIGTGNPGGGSFQGRSSQGRGQPGAVGTAAGDVSVSEAGSGGGGSQLTSGGPSGSTGLNRRTGSGLPAGSGPTGSGPSGGTARSGTSLADLGNFANGTRGGAGLSGTSSDGNARLGSSAGGQGDAGSSRGTGRRAALAGLPEGSLRAEAAGELVTAGPQGGSSSGTSAPGGRGVSRMLAGPSTGSVGRRRSGLPLGGGGPSSGSGIGRRRTSPGGARSSGLGSRRSSGGSSRPSMASAQQVASMIERRVPGISPIPSRRLNATFSMRTPEGRAEAVAQLGGSEASEAAVERGLEWLAQHQFAAGNWSIHDYNCVDHRCEHRGKYRADSAATGMALLAFLGAGNTHQSGTHNAVVARGLNWLRQRQADNGDLFGEQTEFCWLYSHGMATIALCEAYGMTKDPELREPAQRAVNFIVASQHPKFGGWRYRPQYESDTSVSGWQLMALKSAEIAGLDVPRNAYAGVSKWLDSVEKDDAKGRFSYHPTMQVTPTMTAEGLLMRQYLGAQRTDSSLLSGAAFLRQRLPRTDARDVYYWYYGTQVMFHLQGEHWADWNASLRDMLVETQDKAGHDRGSWSPVDPDKDEWGESGGRHYVTCLNLLMLEVYYRHLPLYLDLNH